MSEISSVNSSSVSAASYTSAPANTESKAPTEAATDKTAEAINGTSAVYEASSKSDASDAKKATYANPQLVQSLKDASNAHIQQLQDIVNKLLTKQGETFNAANGLKSFYESLEVDDATRAQAQADIAEDGYWGVNQTSDRILDFAKALSGGDPEKMEEMRKAFQKGFDQATKAWGDKLPQISQDTYDAVMKKFDDYAANYKAGQSEE